MQYKIAEIISEKPAQYGKTNYRFKVEGDNRAIGVFSKYPMRVGQEISGSIVPNGQWFNFKFGTDDASPNTPKADMGPAALTPGLAELKNMINLGVRPQLTELKAILFAIAAKLEVKIPDARGYDYPEMDNTNNSDAFDDGETSIITRADSPF